MITAGNSDGNGLSASKYTFAPTAQHLSLAATLVVHPDYTIRGSPAGNLTSDAALKFLYNCFETLGPVDSPFSQAFEFNSKRVERRKSRKTEDSYIEIDEHIEDFTSEYITKEAVFSQVENIWQVVGWAFNSLETAPKRWSRWRLLLIFWLELAEQDMAVRTKSTSQFPKDGITASMFRKATETSEQKGILRAIFANGTSSLHEFGEVFRNETKERKKKDEADLKARPKLDLDGDDYGDYDIKDEDIEMEDAQDETEHESYDAYDARRMEGISLRARFLSFMLAVTVTPGNPYQNPTYILDKVSEFIQSLDLTDFVDLLARVNTDSSVRIGLLLNTIESYMSTGVQQRRPGITDEEYILKNYLHGEARASSPIDNAKLSILIEYLIAAMIDGEGIEYHDQLYRLVRKGIDARLRKADRNKKGRHKSDEEKDADAILKHSSDRIVGYMDLIKGM